MSERGTPYKGVLYAGLMLAESGPKVLEFNCRLGDPETQVVIPLLASDPLELMMACAQGNLGKTNVSWDNRNYVGVVMVSGGYPGEYKTGFEISGLDEDGPKDTMVFHAGTKLDPIGTPLTAGGRVLTVVGGGDTIESARDRAYSRLELIGFQDAHWRRDISSSANQNAAETTG
jgi:phosphoribosylamine--glycine ligase